MAEFVALKKFCYLLENMFGSLFPRQLKLALGCCVGQASTEDTRAKRKQHNLSAISCCVSCLIHLLF